MKVLCMRTDRLGETLLTLPAIRFLKENIKGARIHLFAQNFIRPLAENLEFVDYFHPFPGNNYNALCLFSGEFIRIAAEVRRLKPDMVVCFNPRKDLHLLAFLSGAGNRAGYRRKWAVFLNNTLPDNKQRGIPEFMYNLELANLLVGKEDPFSEVGLFSFFNGMPCDVAREAMLKAGIDTDKKYVIVHPFSSDERKRWPYERWRAFLERVNSEVIVVGDNRERGIAEALFSDMPQIHIAAGFWDIYELACVLANFGKAFVGLDSGPMHLAYMCGVRVFVLWGYADPARWGPPQGYGNIVVFSDNIKDLSVEAVINKYVEFTG